MILKDNILLNEINIYYIGRHSSDITTTFDGKKHDPFFKGSITRYGDNENGNIAYNVQSGLQLNDDDLKYGERNSKVDSAFIAKKCKEIVAADPKAYFLPYSVYYSLKIPSEFKKRIICCNSPKILVQLESKFNFKNLIKDKIQQAPFELKKGKEVLSLIKSGFIPNKKEVVIQSEFSAGGEGTLIGTKQSFTNININSEIEEKIKPNETYVVSDYIENICSASFQIQITENEIAAYPPGVQLMKGPSYFGNDLYAFTQLRNYDQIKKEIGVMVKNIGDILRTVGDGNKKARGFMGIDIVIAKNGPPYVYAIELNPRYTGVTGLMNILSHQAGIGSVYEHSFNAFYSKNTDLQKKLDTIMPTGRKIYADKEIAANHLTNRNQNNEGYHLTHTKEKGAYTYAIFQHIKDYNTFDYRNNIKKYAARHVNYFKQKLNTLNRKPEIGSILNGEN